MMPNQEKFEEQTRKCFEKLVEDLSWENIQELWALKPSLKKTCLDRGYRELKKYLEYFRKQISRKYDKEFSGFIFHFWEKHNKSEWLNDYLSSDEYKKWKEEQKENQTGVTFNSKSFREFCNSAGNQKVLYYMFFSTSIRFSEEQVKEIMFINEKEINNNEKLSDTEEVTKDTKSTKEFKKLQKENKQLKNKLEQARTQITDKDDQIHKYIQEKKQLKQKITEKYRCESDELSHKIHELEQELCSLLSKLEEKNSDIERLNNIINDSESKLKKLNLKLEKEKSSNNNFYRGVIEKIDMKGMIESCNEQDEIKVLLSSVVCSPKSDREIENDMADNYFYQFWKSQVAFEMKVIEKITGYNLNQVVGRSFINGEWDPDNFNDLKYSLRARAFLINIFYEIIREYISDSNIKLK